MAGTTNTQISKQLDQLEAKFAQFMEQYDHDMRGDARLNGGSKGVIGTVRDIKQCQDDYPSITWLLSHRTIKTVGALMLVYAVLMTLWSAGLFSVLSGAVGIDIAIPPTPTPMP